MVYPPPIQAEKLWPADSCQRVIVDVRSQTEYVAKHLVGPHIMAPISDLNPQDLLLRHGLTSDVQFFTVCQNGGRAVRAAKQMVDAGLPNVTPIEGGIPAMERAGFPTTGLTTSQSEESGLSLERQVRIGAGALILLSFLLALIIHPYFAAIAAFVGAGLLFAGVTDFCGMALLLMKAPWNKGCTGAACAIGAGADKGEGCQ